MKKNTFFLALFLILSLGIYAQEKIHGLAVITEFDDFQYEASDAAIDSLLNQKSGYNKSNNVGSLYEYFKAVSYTHLRAHET